MHSVYVAVIYYETQIISTCYVNLHIVMGANYGKIPYKRPKYGLD
ncbi:hypothetical protein VCRA2121O391_390051 [Vibrio crassostreae]|nr:hypothetical protein VCRA2113O356_300025 [Vibrio crassostreae]CAK2114456.1 hypothetical protein VCRA2117O378_420051 [Vibrio crassostreae]CAK2354726.1 hypothetical protein VCRA2116O372_320012 [Vibrio crassostreae]CAK2370058.1 hypothetical protein VCRA2119O386_480002 [Vibrio crassostreae]CAK2492262.1 hypothetical protein VCRA2117O377_320011 [Vibrio crassostreae]